MNKIVIGIDIGGSTTKIAGFTDSKKLIIRPRRRAHRADIGQG